MDLIDLAFGKWLYLTIYLFFPALTIIYLIHIFGLETKDDPLLSARNHIDQASYWTEITLRTVQSTVKSKSFASLEYTIQRNLNRALKFLANADPHSDEVKSLKKECRRIERKLKRIRLLGTTTSSLPTSSAK